MFYRSSDGKMYNLLMFKLISTRKASDGYSVFFDNSLVESFDEEFHAIRFIIWLKDEIKAGVRAMDYSDFKRMIA
jgi:hypothetical protein